MTRKTGDTSSGDEPTRQNQCSYTSTRIYGARCKNHVWGNERNGGMCIWHEEIYAKSNDILTEALELESGTERLCLVDAYLPAANLRNADLTGADLSFANLSDADLSNADLSGAEFAHADLSGADFRYADLSNAFLRYADLSGADFRYADLSDAFLLTVDLSKTNLRSTNFSKADLGSADLSEADLEGVSLSEARLSVSKLSGADLTSADLTGADLWYADLSRADLSGANLSGANLFGANLSGADLAGANLSGADLAGANLSGANLWHADLTGARLTYADLSDVDLTNTKIFIGFPKPSNEVKQAISEKLLPLKGGVELAALVALWMGSVPSEFSQELKQLRKTEDRQNRSVQESIDQWKKESDEKFKEFDEELVKGFAKTVLGMGASDGGMFTPIDVGTSIGFFLAEMHDRHKSLTEPTKDFREALEKIQNPEWRTKTLQENKIRSLLQPCRLQYDPELPSYDEVAAAFGVSSNSSLLDEYKNRNSLSYGRWEDDWPDLQNWSRDIYKAREDHWPDGLNGVYNLYLTAALINELAEDERTAVVLQAPFNYNHQVMQLFRRYLSYLFDEEDARKRQDYANTTEPRSILFSLDDGRSIHSVHDLVICFFALPEEAGLSHLEGFLARAKTQENQNLHGDPTFYSGTHGDILKPRIWLVKLHQLNR